VRLNLLVDSGAIYSVIPSKTLERLGIQPHGERSFMLADGTEITRFGKPGDSALLGIVSLGALGFALDPIRRVLRPLPMILGRATGV